MVCIDQLKTYILLHRITTDHIYITEDNIVLKLLFVPLTLIKCDSFYNSCIFLHFFYSQLLFYVIPVTINTDYYLQFNLNSNVNGGSLIQNSIRCLTRFLLQDRNKRAEEYNQQIIKLESIINKLGKYSGNGRTLLIYGRAFGTLT